MDNAPAHDRQRLQRLRTLIERSKIYTSILSDKLQKQQAEAKSRGEALDRAAEAKSKKENAVPTAATRKSTRTAAAEPAPETGPSLRKTRTPTEPAQETKTSPRKTRAPPKKKAGKTTIADYFSKKDLQTDLSTTEALDKAREEGGSETDVGVTAVTKPSASARQPELITGCVLRDYQVPSPRSAPGVDIVVGRSGVAD
jgi:ATP-dependent DNA helicase